MGLSTITPGKVQEYRVHRIATSKARKAPTDDPDATPPKPPARSTIHDEIVALRQVMKTAIRHEWLAHLPDFSPPYKASGKVTSTVDEIARQVQGSAVIASEAVKQARMTDSRIARLAQAASRIGAVVELINTIAGQTNLLALNATIEAARAGDAGRGFAVVAAEVKTLAEQTAKATGEISAQVAEIQSATNESVISIKEISATIGRISEIASTIAAAVEQQGAATCEISRNVQQAAAGTTKVSHSIFEVRSGAGETGQASRRVLSAAKSLSDESGRLKSELGLFLDSVRAA